MRDVFIAPSEIIIPFIFTASSPKNRQITNGRPQPRARLGTRSRFEVRQKVSWQILSHTNDELAAPLLRHAKFPCVFNLRMHAVSKRTRFLLDAGEVFTPGCRANPQHILHHKYTRPKETHVTEKIPIKLTPRIILESHAVICAIHLARGAKPLARWPPNNDIHALRANQFSKLFGVELRQIALKGMPHWNAAWAPLFNEVGTKRGNRFRIKVNCRQNLKTGTLHTQCEPPAATKKVKACQRVG